MHPQRETAEALSQAQRVAEDRAKTIKTLQTKLDSNTVQLKQYESDVKDLEEQCTLWRAKVRHRHRALEVPHFAKSKTGQKEKEEWMKEKALDDSLGAAIAPFCHRLYGPLSDTMFTVCVQDSMTP